jgi:uncharacterized protein (DUF2252 family)
MAGAGAEAGRAPLALLGASDRRRLPDLVPIRHARMLASPFAFLRGAPGVMAHDLATTPVSGITVQACGDAHLLNFGLFATPERNLVFGLNDFDETLPAPWEWDVNGWVEEVLARYRSSLSDERRQLLGRFRPHDAARKVVGVGSVGTRCCVLLLLSDRGDDPLLLQVKQATASVLERYAGRSRFQHPGRRVVNDQRLLASSGT